MRSKFVSDGKKVEGADAQAAGAGAGGDPLSCAQFECGLCKEKFSSVDDLASHVDADHEINAKNTLDAVAEEDEFPEDVEEEPEDFDEGAAAMMQVDDEIHFKKGNSCERPSALPIVVKVEPVKAVGPDGMDRNWAATFGYGKTTSLKTSLSFDLISAMKTKFDKNDGEEDTIDIIKEEIDDGGGGGGPENDDDEFTIYRVRGFKGRIKASLKKTPRTLSESSRSARKRMDMLVRAAREQWAKKEGRKNKKEPTGNTSSAATARKKSQTRKGPPANKATPAAAALAVTRAEPSREIGLVTARNRSTLSAETVTAAEVEAASSADRTIDRGEITAAAAAEEEVEDAASDADSDFDDFDDEEDELLIPLANSWVCEKRPNEERTKWLTIFWSPEGDQYASLKEVEEAQKKLKQKLDMSVFKRAWSKDPGRIPTKSK